MVEGQSQKAFPVSWDQFHRDARALAWRLAGAGPFEAIVCITRGVSFLVDVRGMTEVKARCPMRATYHDSCSGLRELGIKSQPRKLLESVEGLTLVEMRDAETCCGFGGLFAVKYGEISDAIVSQKTKAIDETGADLLLAGDLGCLMNMAGKLAREGKPVEARHVAEVLADMLDAAPIGAPQPGAPAQAGEKA